MDISLYTSLYRTEAHLDTYITRARHMIDVLHKAGLTLELVLIANDATDFERERIAQLQAAHAHVQVIHVPRETLYASWNRGVRAARADVLAPWNVDDDYFPQALVEGYQHIKGGCEIVYFGCDIVRLEDGKRSVIHQDASPFDPQAHRNKMLVGPFPMFTRRIYDQLGGFHERFRILGDFEFFHRATHLTTFCPINMTGGAFIIHGGNLSTTGNPREWAETNIVHLLHNNHAALRLCPPDVMQAVFRDFADEIPLTPHLERLLWGDIAVEKWTAHERMLRRDRLREWPRRVIDGLGLRPVLYRAGILKTPPQK